jgi:hypothetical protein
VLTYDKAFICEPSVALWLDKDSIAVSNEVVKLANAVLKDALAKVQDILKNPPGNWKTEVNKTQQQNATAPKTETQTAQNSTKPAEKKEEKVAATPAVDLNNKDALVVLKTLADYQRRTIDAVNNLNGNILKRA